MDGNAYLEYIFNLYSPLNVDLSMFSNFSFNFVNIAAYIACGELSDVTTDPKNLRGFSTTEAIVTVSPDSPSWR